MRENTKLLSGCAMENQEADSGSATEEAEECRRIILSEEYGDFIFDNRGSQSLDLEGVGLCLQRISSRFSCLYANERLWQPLRYETTPYEVIPKLYGLMDTQALREAGISQVRQSMLSLTGTGVLIGVIDTGIDYTHPAFLEITGRTRIEAIWDQTAVAGTPPSSFFYGAVYGREEINEALENPERAEEIVPEKDEIGHGTFLAGLAAGSPVRAEPVIGPGGLSQESYRVVSLGDSSEQIDYIGAAPESLLAVVKCKPAKQYLRDFYGIKEEALAYQENDIMLGISWILQIAERLGTPVVILLGMGTSYGGHTGTSRLGEYLTASLNQLGVSCVLPTGNETGLGHHFRGSVSAEGEFETVEIRVDQGERGFLTELWSQAPDRFTLSIQSPGGDTVPQIALRLGQDQTLNFPLERTTIEVSYRALEVRGGGYLAALRFQTPSPGIWTIRVYSLNFLSGVFDMWLPIQEFIREGTYFLKPNPDTTLTEPATVYNAIGVAGYDSETGGIDIRSGRGFTRTGGIKPDLAAPGVGVPGPAPGGRYTLRTGTSGAAAITAGAAACLLEWGIVRGNKLWIDNTALKASMIQGAVRNPSLSYPNREWGYGKLNLLNTVVELF